jgi:hypothetical protein
MAEILGYDIDGSELRAGDRVAIIGGPNVNPGSVGGEHTIDGPPTHKERQVAWRAGLDPRRMVRFEDGTGIYCEFLRRINSGRDLFNQCRDCALSEPQGVPDESTVEAGMPWTGGG